MAGREGAITVSDKVESGETGRAPGTVVVHPLVLLSTVDHYTRVAKDTKKRVVGVLLGTRSRGPSVDVTNSFAVPFEEDAKNNSIWYLDHNYLETMYRMYKKVNAREIIVGAADRPEDQGDAILKLTSWSGPTAPSRSS